VTRATPPPVVGCVVSTTGPRRDERRAAPRATWSAAAVACSRRSQSENAQMPSPPHAPIAAAVSAKASADERLHA
jgi:hypothetical protein